MLSRCEYLIYSRVLRSCRTHNFTPKRFYYIDGPTEPLSPIPGRFPKWSKNTEEMFGSLSDNANIFLHGGAATPTFLSKQIVNYAVSHNLKNIKVFHIHTEGEYPFTEGEAANHFRSSSFFVATNCREAVSSGIADYIPIFLSEIPLLFRQKLIALDYALISVSPPDEHGFCSLGTSVDIVRPAIQNAKYIIGQVNKHVPFTRGEAAIHISHIDYLLPFDVPLHETRWPPITTVENTVGSIVAETLVSDGATLQIGICFKQKHV
ncbi:unnamed protein product [Protopolystoma xenopodis]|uniref:Acetyl-CoA hydrolase/transferase N-terminal domain-containing protein n=1 Tax=Protopolystoma xenopodis TaxID=117903 RepID=A0A3S5CF88_9PLAT|nr:unnamed protein product [Protopolystoma xenopodis]